jgi:hypothetical protein
MVELAGLDTSDEGGQLGVGEGEVALLGVLGVPDQDVTAGVGQLDTLPSVDAVA